MLWDRWRPTEKGWEVTLQWDVWTVGGRLMLAQLHRDVAALEGVSAFWVVLECDGIASHSAHSPDSALWVKEILKIILYDVRNPKMLSDSISAAGFARHETCNSLILPLSSRSFNPESLLTWWRRETYVCYFVFVFEVINYITVKIVTDLPSSGFRHLPLVSFWRLF
jgi:hypothetical protein